MKTIIIAILCTCFLSPFAMAENKEKIHKKLKIVIPRIVLKNTTPQEAFAILKRLSREMDPEGEGVNIIYVSSKKKPAANK